MTLGMILFNCISIYKLIINMSNMNLFLIKFN